MNAPASASTRWLALAFRLLGALPSAAQDPPAAQPEWSAAVSSTNALGLQLVWDVRPGENTVLSPLALGLGLGQVYAGAGGQMRSEMRAVLSYPGDEGLLHRGFENLQHEFQALLKRDGGKISMQFDLACVSGLFVQQGFLPYQEWLTCSHGTMGVDRRLWTSSAPRPRRPTR